jgi:hypothetical protein
MSQLRLDRSARPLFTVGLSTVFGMVCRRSLWLSWGRRRSEGPLSDHPKSYFSELMTSMNY